MPQVGKQCPLESPGLGGSPSPSAFQKFRKGMLWTEKLVLFPNSPPHLCGHRKVRVCASEGGNWASPPELLNNRSHHITACQSSPRAFKAALLWPSGSPLLPPALHPHLRPDPRQPGSHVRPVPHLLLTALWSSHLSLCWAPPTLQAPFLLCPSLESPS